MDLVGGKEDLLPRCENAAPRGDPLLVVSDIHGDAAALESVLSAVAHLPLCGMVAAGDHCLGGPAPYEVWQRLVSQGATMVRGLTDYALGAVGADSLQPHCREDEARLENFQQTRAALGELICRRLAHLPTSAIFTLPTGQGVMVVHGSPSDRAVALGADLKDHELAGLTGCVAEEVLVVGRTNRGFIRQCGSLLVVNAGAVGESPVKNARGERTAHFVLIQAFDDQSIRACGHDVAVDQNAWRDRGRSRRAG
jgi:predicted phosphodiesterase